MTIFGLLASLAVTAVGVYIAAEASGDSSVTPAAVAFGVLLAAGGLVLAALFAVRI